MEDNKILEELGLDKTRDHAEHVRLHNEFLHYLRSNDMVTKSFLKKEKAKSQLIEWHKEYIN